MASLKTSANLRLRCKMLYNYYFSTIIWPDHKQEFCLEIPIFEGPKAPLTSCLNFWLSRLEGPK